jgi:hypothetical protein
MAKSSTSFKPGQSGNPKGQPKLDKHLKEVQKLTGVRFNAIVSKYASCSKEELYAIVQDPKTSVLDLTVCSILSKAMSQGDHGRLNFLLDRTIGKVKEVKEVQVAPKPFIIKRRNGDVITMGAKPVDEAVEAEVVDDE